jgi:adenylate kinase family enzyme
VETYRVQVKRIAVTGPAGAGKSRLAREIGDVCGIEVLHLDALFWRPGWRETPAAEWEERQRNELERDSWIVDAQYDDMLLDWFEAADLVVVVDASPLRCLWGVSKRRLAGGNGPDVPPESEPAPVHRALANFTRGQWHYRRSVRPRLLATLARCRARQGTVLLRSGGETRRFMAHLPRRREPF